MRVLLLEPDAWRRLGIAIYLRGCCVDVTADSKCERFFTSHDTSVAPDAVLLAHGLIDQYGSEIIDRLHAAYPSAAILVHGESGQLDTVAALLLRGAQGYFRLSCEQEQLFEALKIVCGGGVWAPRAALAMLTRPQAARDIGEETATGDRIVLQLLCEGLSNKEIANRLGLAEVTVKARLTRLYRRYGVKTRLQLLMARFKPNVA